MNATSVRDAVKRASPSKPINIRLVDGTLLQIRHPENITISTPRNEETEGLVIVWEGEESPHLFDLNAIAVISHGKGRAAAAR